MGNGKIRKWLGIGTVIGALGLGYGAGMNHDKITGNLEERTIQANALNLEKKVQFNVSGKEHQTYIDLKPYFLIVKNSFNIQNESEIGSILNAITQILAHIEKKKLDYGKGNDEYNYIVNKFEPDVKSYFRYVLSNLKAKYYQNEQLKQFYIK